METTVLSVFRRKLVVTVGVSLKGQRFCIFPNCMMGFQAAALIERGECAFISVLFCWSARRPASASLSKGDSTRARFKQINHLRVAFIIILSHLFFLPLSASKHLCVGGSLSPLRHSAAVLGEPALLSLCLYLVHRASVETAREMRGNFLSIQVGQRARY